MLVLATRIQTSSLSMRRLLSLCDDFAAKFDLKFNASKFQFLVHRATFSVTLDQRSLFCVETSVMVCS